MILYSPVRNHYIFYSGLQAAKQLETSDLTPMEQRLKQARA